jgi:hypothetical protein
MPRLPLGLRGNPGAYTIKSSQCCVEVCKLWLAANLEFGKNNFG